ncbi:MAG: hypothetical protein H6736_01520 [Alphaproteobacteria bacterium]|nr:hypothetical protein [Alphaproteobacteria bacterium]
MRWGLAGVLLACLACGSGRRGLPHRPVPDDAPTVMVMVAARDLYPAVTIEPEDLFAIEIPAAYLPDGVFLAPEHVVGRRPRQRILVNEFVRGGHLADPESGRGLADILPSRVDLY